MKNVCSLFWKMIQYHYYLLFIIVYLVWVYWGFISIDCSQVFASDLPNTKWSILSVILRYRYCFIRKITYKNIDICQYKMPCAKYKCEEGLINIMSKYLRKIPCYEVCSISALYFVIMSDSQTLDIYLSIYKNERRSFDNSFEYKLFEYHKWILRLELTARIVNLIHMPHWNRRWFESNLV